jgi:hypothetical protein
VFSFDYCMFISGGLASVALEDLFPEKEAHLILYI